MRLSSAIGLGCTAALCLPAVASGQVQTFDVLRTSSIDPFSAVLATQDGSLTVATSSSGVTRLAPDGRRQVLLRTGTRLTRPAGLVAWQGGLVINDALTRLVLRRQDGSVTTLAGTGSRGYAGDGGPASAAMFAGIGGMSASRDGGLLIADTGNGRIRRVSPDRTIQTVAGDGGADTQYPGGDPDEAPNAADDRPALQTTLFPSSVGALPNGATLIGDRHRIRVARPDGTLARLLTAASPFAIQSDGTRGFVYATPAAQRTLDGGERPGVVVHVGADGKRTVLLAGGPSSSARPLAISAVAGGVFVAIPRRLVFLQHAPTPVLAADVDVARPSPTRLRVKIRLTRPARVRQELLLNDRTLRRWKPRRTATAATRTLAVPRTRADNLLLRTTVTVGARRVVIRSPIG